MVIIVVAMLGGSTYAWFTASAEVPDNEFTAGTVNISADREVGVGKIITSNWNPGDNNNVNLKVVNDGTKSIYLRAIITGKWYDADGVTEFIPNPAEEVVTWSFYDTTTPQNWTKVGDTWYYNEPIKGTYTESNLEARKVTLHLKICFNGPKSENQYQGKVFKLTAVFESVQSSNGAVDEVWAGNPY